LVEPLTDAFLTASFVVTTDWLPLRIELSDPALGRHIDIHPAYDDGAGGCWQHGFGDDRFVTPADTITEGVIAGRSVRCITVAHQLHLHEGYDPDAQGLADIEILRRLDRRRDGPHGRPHQP
jgi:lincosamide nucleotidyltransferase A/C/D/E